MSKDEEFSISRFLAELPDTQELNKELIKERYEALEGDYAAQAAYIDKLHQQAVARATDLKRQVKKQERAARTRRLIQLGALVESVMGENIDHDLFREDLKLLYERWDKDAQIYMAIAGIAEQFLGREFTEADVQRFHNYLQKEENAGHYYSSYMNKRM